MHYLTLTERILLRFGKTDAAALERKHRPALSDDKTERNKRVQSRYDGLMQTGKHGHYETLFRVVREEVERDRAMRGGR